MNDIGGTVLDSMDILQIMETIPHRYPMLLIDRVVDIVENESAAGIKQVTINEPFFEGHFPKHPVMPGVLIVEAMAQTAAALVLHSLGDKGRDKLVYFMSIESAKFRRPVYPGSELRIPVQKIKQRGDVWRFDCEATVEGVVAAQAVVTAMLRDY